MSSIIAGKLVLKITEANLTVDKDLFSKQDPYVIIKCGDKTVQTRVIKSGGKHPIWNEVSCHCF